MCLSRHPVQCSFLTYGITLQQTEKFDNLGFTFWSDGRQDSKLGIRIGKASAVMRMLYRSVAPKRELCTKTNLSIFRSVFVPILTNGWYPGSPNKRDLEYRQPEWVSCEKS